MVTAQAVCRKASSVGFWDGYAPWYRLWLEHTAYHERILDVLFARAEPGWRVLDIGSGSGVLCLPLSAMGCEVTALEPSVGMRSLLFAEAFRREDDRFTVDERRWEETWHDDFLEYDLALACNSLHLTTTGFTAALGKVFRSAPRHVFLATESGPGIDPAPSFPGYATTLERTFRVGSSFAYHSLEEALEHWSFKRGRPLTPLEAVEVEERLVRRGGHLWIEDAATVHMTWWERLDAPAVPRPEADRTTRCAAPAAAGG